MFKVQVLTLNHCKDCTYEQWETHNIEIENIIDEVRSGRFNRTCVLCNPCVPMILKTLNVYSKGKEVLYGTIH